MVSSIGIGRGFVELEGLVKREHASTYITCCTDVASDDGHKSLGL